MKKKKLITANFDFYFHSEIFFSDKFKHQEKKKLNSFISEKAGTSTKFYVKIVNKHSSYLDSIKDNQEQWQQQWKNVSFCFWNKISNFEKIEDNLRMDTN